VSHHFISPACETGYDFIHHEGFCADGDAFPGRVCDVSESRTDRMPLLRLFYTNMHDPYQLGPITKTEKIIRAKKKKKKMNRRVEALN